MLSKEEKERHFSMMGSKAGPEISFTLMKVHTPTTNENVANSNCRGVKYLVSDGMFGIVPILSMVFRRKYSM